MERRPAAMALTLAALFAWPAGGAGRFPVQDQLNDASRSTWANDTADVRRPRLLLYETRQDQSFSVSYNLIRQGDGDVKGYFVRLTIKNLSETAVTAPADVTLVDAENSVISATDRDTFLKLASTLAGAKVPTTTFRPLPRSTLVQEGYAQAYLRGQAEGRILKATADIATGKKMTVWADSFWLKPAVDLPPHGQVSGVRAFLAEPYHPLPLTVRVRVGGSIFEFTTRGN